MNAVEGHHVVAKLTAVPAKIPRKEGWLAGACDFRLSRRA